MSKQAMISRICTQDNNKFYKKCPLDHQNITMNRNNVIYLCQKVKKDRMRMVEMTQLKFYEKVNFNRRYSKLITTSNNKKKICLKFKSRNMMIFRKKNWNCINKHKKSQHKPKDNLKWLSKQNQFKWHEIHLNKQE